MTNEEIFAELKKILPPENFHVEPATSHQEILQLEKTYQINTTDFLNKSKDISHIPTEIQDEWINTLETYIFFDGIWEEINHIEKQ